VNDRHPIHRGATREQQILTEQAEQRGYIAGLADGIRLSTELLERHGHQIGAQRLREAKLIEVGEATNGQG
jgi:hypothetical protein